MIHYAKLSKSPRLQKVLAYLESCPSGASTLQIIKATGVCAVNSIISELRRNGHPVACWFQSRTADGSSVYVYKLGPKAVYTSKDPSYPTDEDLGCIADAMEEKDSKRMRDLEESV